MNRKQRIELYSLVGKYIFRGLSALLSMVMVSLFAGVDVFTGILCAILTGYFFSQAWMVYIVGLDVLVIVDEEMNTSIVRMSGRKWQRTEGGGLRSVEAGIGTSFQTSPSPSVPGLEVL